MDDKSLKPHSENCRDARLATMGLRIRMYRRRKNWTQDDLAWQINSSEGKAYISRIEHGKANISVIVLCRIADALEVSVRDLVDF